MNRTPLICPHCGELVLAWIADARTLVVPAHPDRVMPSEECGVHVLVTKGNVIRQS